MTAGTSGVLVLGELVGDGDGVSDLVGEWRASAATMLWGWLRLDRDASATTGATVWSPGRRTRRRRAGHVWRRARWRRWARRRFWLTLMFNWKRARRDRRRRLVQLSRDDVAAGRLGFGGGDELRERSVQLGSLTEWLASVNDVGQLGDVLLNSVGDPGQRGDGVGDLVAATRCDALRQPRRRWARSCW